MFYTILAITQSTYWTLKGAGKWLLNSLAESGSNYYGYGWQMPVDPNADYSNTNLAAQDTSTPHVDSWAGEGTDDDPWKVRNEYATDGPIHWEKS